VKIPVGLGVVLLTTAWRSLCLTAPNRIPLGVVEEAVVVVVVVV